MTIGLLAGCMQDKDEPKQDEKPVDEKIQDDIDNIEKETDDMFDEGDVEQNNPDTGTDDKGNVGETGDKDETDAPEESEDGDMTDEQKKDEDEEQ